MHRMHHNGVTHAKSFIYNNQPIPNPDNTLVSELLSGTAAAAAQSVMHLQAPHYIYSTYFRQKQQPTRGRLDIDLHQHKPLSTHIHIYIYLRPSSYIILQASPFLSLSILQRRPPLLRALYYATESERKSDKGDVCYIPGRSWFNRVND